MKKAILLLILLSSCATKKVTDSEIETNASTTIDASKFSQSFTLEPVNLDKPILIGGKEYINTRVIHNNTKEIVKVKDTIAKKEEIKIKEKDYTQTIETISNKLIWLILATFVLYQLVSYLKSKTPL